MTFIGDVDLELAPVQFAWTYATTGRDEAMEQELEYLDVDELEAVAAAAKRMADFARRLAVAKRNHVPYVDAAMRSPKQLTPTGYVRVGGVDYANSYVEPGKVIEVTNDAEPVWPTPEFPTGSVSPDELGRLDPDPHDYARLRQLEREFGLRDDDPA